MFDSSILRYGKLVMPATVKASACSCRTSPVERKANSLQSAFVGTRKALCVTVLEYRRLHDAAGPESGETLYSNGSIRPLKKEYGMTLTDSFSTCKYKRIS